MTQPSQDFSQLAADARAVAAEQVLDNVRQKHLTSAATWERLEVGQKKMELLRARRLAGLAGEAAFDEALRDYADDVPGTSAEMHDGR